MSDQIFFFSLELQYHVEGVSITSAVYASTVDVETVGVEQNQHRYVRHRRQIDEALAAVAFKEAFVDQEVDKPTEAVQCNIDHGPDRYLENNVGIF